jgi:hypothetical protein
MKTQLLKNRRVKREKLSCDNFQPDREQLGNFGT